MPDDGGQMAEPPDVITPQQRAPGKGKQADPKCVGHHGERDRRSGHPGRKLADIGQMPAGYADGCVAGGKISQVQIN